MLVAVQGFEERNPGGEPRTLPGVCAFGGCPERSDRVVGRWPLCRQHADRVESAHGNVRTVLRRDGSYVVITDGATVEVSGWVAEAIRAHDRWTEGQTSR